MGGLGREGGRKRKRKGRAGYVQISRVWGEGVGEEVEMEVERRCPVRFGGSAMAAGDDGCFW